MTVPDVGSVFLGGFLQMRVDFYPKGMMVLFAVALCASPLPSAELPFTSGTVLSSALGEAQEVEAADLNGDGMTDIVATGQGAGVIGLWTGIGGGSFSLSTLASGLQSPAYLELADLDGDGDLDAVIGQSANVTGAGQGEVMWFANPLVGVNSSWTPYLVVNYADAKVSDITVADMNSDGKPDIVVAKGINDPGLAWIENDGTPADGGWSSHVVDADYAGLAVMAADLDADGDLDVISSIPGAGLLVWWEHDGVPSDNWSYHTVAAGVSYMSDIACGDVTGDGAIDIVVAYPGSLDDVTLYAASGSSWIAHQVAPVSENDPASVKIVDMDADGDQDILTAVFYSNHVVWYENSDGIGTVWKQRIVNDSLEYARDAVAWDLDGDGDLDVAAVGYFSNSAAWYENRVIHREIAYSDPITARTGLGEPRGVEVGDINRDGFTDMVVAEWSDDTIKVLLGLGDAGSIWLEQILTSSFTKVRDVALADMDGDSDLDVVGAAIGSDQVWWWENDGAAAPGWTSHPVLNTFDGAHCAEPVDIDGDGDLDLAVAAFYGDEVAWVENLNGLGTSWTKYVITGSANGAHDVVAGDLNGDGAPDLAFTAYNGDLVKVLLNPYGTGDDFWSPYNVATGVNGPRGLALGDLDGDGDLDICTALRLDNQIDWYENSGTGMSWISHAVGTGLLIDGSLVRVGDLDQDGDLDVVGTSQSNDDIYFWENSGEGSSWVRRTIEASLDSPWAVALGDVDRNGWLDVVAAAGGAADSVSWYPHVGGQYDLSSWSEAPGTVFSGGEAEIISFQIWHTGMSGQDSMVNPVSATLHLTDSVGTPLTYLQANQVISRLEIFADTDHNGMYTAGDTQLWLDTDLNIVDGAVSLNFGSGTAQYVTVGGSVLYFIVITATADADQQSPNQIQATFVDGELQAEDLSWELPLVATPGSSVSTGVIEFLSESIFWDDFEKNDLLKWDSVISG